MLLVIALIVAFSLTGYAQRPRTVKTPKAASSPSSDKVRPPAQKRPEVRRWIINAKIFGTQRHGAKENTQNQFNFVVPSFMAPPTSRQPRLDRQQLFGSFILKLNPTWRTTSDQHFHQSFGKPNLCLQKDTYIVCPKASIGLERGTGRVKWSGGFTLVF
jgi:hypothetical protein